MRLLAVGIVAGWLAVGGAQAAPIRVQADAQPARAGVGDAIRYVVVARFPASAVDASSVRIFADAGALVQTGPATTTRRVDGSALVVTLVQHVACLDLPCAPAAGARRVRLPAPRVTAELTDRGVAIGRTEPVTVVVEPRVAGADVRAATPPYRQQTALPAADGRAGGLSGPFTAAAAVFALIAVLLAVVALRPRSRPDAHEAELARAVRLLRESAGRPVSDRRRAADLVSRVTGSVGARSIAADAARLAWSESSPKAEGTVALAERAEDAGR
ncbi:MAG TPA: hypothetical protein VGF10_12485 [Gaiella sp.]|jgi:hypothetical protein